MGERYQRFNELKIKHLKYNYRKNICFSSCDYADDNEDCSICKEHDLKCSTWFKWSLWMWEVREINWNLFKLEGPDPLIVCTQIYFQLIAGQLFWFIPAVLRNSRRSTGLPPLHAVAICAWFSVNRGHVSQIREWDVPWNLWTWECVAGRERGQAVRKGSISPFSVSSLSSSLLCSSHHLPVRTIQRAESEEGVDCPGTALSVWKLLQDGFNYMKDAALIY